MNTHHKSKHRLRGVAGAAKAGKRKGTSSGASRRARTPVLERTGVCTSNCKFVLEHISDWSGQGRTKIYNNIISTARHPFLKTQTRGGIPKPSGKKVRKISQVANSSRNLSPPVCFADFVDCDVVLPLCRGALVWVVKGKEAIGIWSYAHVGCSYNLPPTPTYQSLLLCVCAFFCTVSRAYCCQDGDGEVFAVQLILAWLDVAGAGGAAHVQHDTLSAAFFGASSTSLWRCTSLQRSVVHGLVAALLVLWLYPFGTYTFLGSLLSSLFRVSFKPIICIFNALISIYP